MTTCLIAMGSNLGDRLGHLHAGLRSLAAHPAIRLDAVSGLYETAPVGGPLAQGPYLNAAARITTDLAPESLLEALHRVEAERERQRSARWGPRTLDLDILIHGEVVSDDPIVTLPHPRMHERRFAMVPACDLAPDLTHPREGRSLRAILAGLPVEPGDLELVSWDWAPGIATPPATSPEDRPALALETPA